MSDVSWKINVRDFSENRGSRSGAVIVLASGPSAGDFPLRESTDLPVVALNGSIVKCVSENVQPLFYVCDDGSFIEKLAELAKEGVQSSQNVAMTLSGYESLDRIYRGLSAGEQRSLA